MKKLLLACLLLLSITVYGQNWRPFVPKERYAYQISTDTSRGTYDGYLIVTQVASGTTIGANDTVWRYEHIYSSIGGCHSANYSFSPFGSEVRVAGRHITFYLWDDQLHRSDSLVVDPSFTDDYTSGSYSVNVLGKEWAQVNGGFDDSIWTARITNPKFAPSWSHVLRLSRNYGLQQSPQLTQAGYLDDSLSRYAGGAQMVLRSYPAYRPPHLELPTPARLFTFHAGDTLGYHEILYPYGLGWPSHTWSRIAIRTVEFVDDYVVYTADYFSHYEPEIRTLNPPDPTEYVKNPAPYRFGCRLNSLYVSDIAFYDLAGSQSFVGNFFIETVGGDTLVGMTDTGNSEIDSTGCLVENIVADGDSRFNTYLPGRGRIVTEHPPRLISKEIQDCYRINGQGIPCGTILLAATSPNLDGSPRLAQNPVTTQLEVLSPSPLHLILQDLQGRTVAEGRNTKTLSTQSIPAGLYLLKAQDKQGRTTLLRIVKQ